MESTTNARKTTILPKPLRLLIIISSTVFVIEGIIMLLEMLFPHIKPIAMGLLDASILTLCLIPVLYRFLYRPMLAYITEQNRLEREMARLDRLNLLGETAASIAHEIRNPMTTIRGFLQMLSQKPDCSQYKENYDLMIQELDRANGIITEFLLMARNKALVLEFVNLNEVIRSLYPMLLADAMLVDKYVNFEPGNIQDLHLDEKEIRQLILNLCRNGLEAMTAGGILSITTEGTPDHVILQVHDQGTGIAPELLDKLGSPFFTTKPDGTGLGLAVCYSIARRHNASMEIKNTYPGVTAIVTFQCRNPLHS